MLPIAVESLAAPNVKLEVIGCNLYVDQTVDAAQALLALEHNPLEQMLFLSEALADYELRVSDQLRTSLSLSPEELLHRVVERARRS